jgi:glycyl-tRNA synthetase beta chain
MELLLEIRTEEMPAAHVQTGLKQMKDRLYREFISHQLLEKKDQDSISAYGTCRRLIMHARIASSQKDSQVTIIGPPAKIAYDSEGRPTKAAEGFARSQEVRVDDLEIIKDDRGEYAAVKKKVKGRPAPALIAEFLPRIIASLSFPKMMKWGSGRFRFSRPIKGICCVCDGQVVSFKAGGTQSSGNTFGHKLFSPEKITPASFNGYKAQLEKNLVLIDASDRRRRIMAQAEAVLKKQHCQIYPDNQLMEKLAYDVEFPYVIAGEFPEEYLKLPLDVLSTAMKVGQSLFSVVKENRQIPMFVGVTDACPDTQSLVKKGNERVLQARLEDARFFWEQDLKTPLQNRVQQLDKIIFQEKLGSYADKTSRINEIVTYLSGKITVSEKTFLNQAAELSKVDLLTEMVREFPSLQGKAGGLYARAEGYPEPVWKAVYDHYKPVNMEDSVPATLNGALLALADKFDSIVGVFGVGIKISGSKDPFGLRRDAQGACMIVLGHELDFPFLLLLNKIISLYGSRLTADKKKLKADISGFFRSRLEYIFEKKGYRYDLVNAALGAGIDNLYHVFLRLDALHKIEDKKEFISLIQTAKRVNNIVKDQPQHRLNPEMLAAKEERELHTTYSILRKNISSLLKNGQFDKAQRMILKIQAVVDNFFDEVLVMDKDARIRKNRIALLQELSRLFLKIADYSKIVIEGE